MCFSKASFLSIFVSLLLQHPAFIKSLLLTIRPPNYVPYSIFTLIPAARLLF